MAKTKIIVIMEEVVKITVVIVIMMTYRRNSKLDYEIGQVDTQRNIFYY